MPPAAPDVCFKFANTCEARPRRACVLAALAPLFPCCHALALPSLRLLFHPKLLPRLGSPSPPQQTRTQVPDMRARGRHPAAVRCERGAGVLHQLQAGGAHPPQGEVGGGARGEAATDAAVVVCTVGRATDGFPRHAMEPRPQLCPCPVTLPQNMEKEQKCPAFDHTCTACHKPLRHDCTYCSLRCKVDVEFGLAPITPRGAAAAARGDSGGGMPAAAAAAMLLTTQPRHQAVSRWVNPASGRWSCSSQRRVLAKASAADARHVCHPCAAGSQLPSGQQRPARRGQQQWQRRHSSCTCPLHAHWMCPMQRVAAAAVRQAAAAASGGRQSGQSAATSTEPGIPCPNKAAALRDLTLNLVDATDGLAWRPGPALL